MDRWERLFLLAALSRGNVSEAEFHNFARREPVDGKIGLADEFVQSGRVEPVDVEEFAAGIEERFQRDHDKTLDQLIRRAAAPLLSENREPQTNAILQAWIGTPTEQAAPALRSKIDRSQSAYDLIEIYAEGGMGHVWSARDPHINRIIAIKRIKPAIASHEEAGRRLSREAKVTAQLEHPNIVPVYDIGAERESGAPFFAMRLLKGRTLEEEIRAFHAKLKEQHATPRDFQRLLEAFLAVCHAISYAHSRGVIHRDLKPSNILLGDFGEVVVLDWGLARVQGADGGDHEIGMSDSSLMGDQHTQAGARLGTPLYMAPEQAIGGKIDERTDVYGLGAVLFEMLANAAPHAEKSAGDRHTFFIRIADEPAPSPAKIVPSAPPALNAICLKAMARVPDDRYGSARELIDDVEKYLAGEPIAVYSEPWGVKLWRWIVRKPLHALASVLIFFIVLLSFYSVTIARMTDLQVAEVIEQEDLQSHFQILDRRISEAFQSLRTDAAVLAQFPDFKQWLQANPSAPIPPRLDDLGRLALGGKGGPRAATLIDLSASPLQRWKYGRNGDGFFTDAEPHTLNAVVAREIRAVLADAPAETGGLWLPSPSHTEGGEWIVRAVVGIIDNEKPIGAIVLEITLADVIATALKGDVRERRLYFADPAGKLLAVCTGGNMRRLEGKLDLFAEQDEEALEKIAQTPIEKERKAVVTLGSDRTFIFVGRFDSLSGRFLGAAFSNGTAILEHTEPVRIRIQRRIFVIKVLTLIAGLSFLGFFIREPGPFARCTTRP